MKQPIRSTPMIRSSCIDCSWSSPKTDGRDQDYSWRVRPIQRQAQRHAYNYHHEVLVEQAPMATVYNGKE